MAAMRLTNRWKDFRKIKYYSVNVTRQVNNSTALINWSPSDINSKRTKYDYIIIGAGHNGLVAANYLAKAGKTVCVLEQRHCVGGACVTEEMVPGFQFSRCSYLLSLFRPNIMKDLKLKEQGLKVFFRDPFSYTPLLEHERKGSARSLFLFRDRKKTYDSISQFSVKDAEAYEQYEAYLERTVRLVDSMIDEAPINVDFSKKGKTKAIGSLLFKGMGNMKLMLNTNWKEVVELFSAPASKILSRWFENDILKGTLATDAVIGAMLSPYSPGSAYVLLHHVMGEIDSVKGAWCYVQGGMGSLTKILAQSAQNLGAHIFVDSSVERIITRPITEEDNRHGVEGVTLKNGDFIEAARILSNATPAVTFQRLLSDQNALPENVQKEIEQMEYESPVTKINVAVDRIPNFMADPSNGKVQPCHFGSIHLNSSSLNMLHDAYSEAKQGRYSSRPMIDMTIPSSLDDSLVDKSKYKNGHVVQLFTQYTPKKLIDLDNGGVSKPWTDEDKTKYAKTVFESIEDYAPGFQQSIIDYDILTPSDLENIFGLTGGNIFHGSLNMDQLYFFRPIPSQQGYETAVKNLYLCGAGTHPGGGVMGACGKLAAEEALKS